MKPQTPESDVTTKHTNHTKKSTGTSTLRESFVESSFPGFHLLPNGHIVVANGLGHGPDHDGTVLVEFDRKGKTVWRHGRPHASFVEVIVLDHLAARGLPSPSEQ